MRNVVFGSMLVIGMAMIVTLGLSTGSTSVAQNANSSTTTKKNSETPQNTAARQPGAQQDFSMNTWELPDDADRTKNPVPTSEESIQKGKELYLDQTKGNCVFCHGETGSGNQENLARLRRKPANLTIKERMSTMTDGEIFWKISKGINGIMPAGEKKMSEEERWDVVNYIRTLAKEPAQQ